MSNVDGFNPYNQTGGGLVIVKKLLLTIKN